MTDDGKEVVREITTAIDHGYAFQAFVKSEIGGLLIERAKRDRAAHVEALIACTREDVMAGKDVEIRIQIEALDVWQRWVAEAINVGRAAEARLHQMEEITGQEA